MAQSQANFGFFMGRQDHVITGVKTSELVDPYGMRKGVVPSLVVGPQLRQRSDKPVKWATVIPPGIDDLPEFSRPRNGASDKIVRGSIERVEQEGGKARNFLVSYRDEQAYYILVRTGLMARNGDGGMEDRLNLQKVNALVSHGSYSFDKASIQIAVANNEEKIREDMADPKKNILTNVAAERMDVKVLGKRIPLIGGGYCPQTSYVLWKVPVGAILLIRDVNGKLTRLVAQKHELRRVDASGYGNFFPMLEEAYIKARRAEIDARNAAAAAQNQTATTSAS